VNSVNLKKQQQKEKGVLNLFIKIYFECSIVSVMFNIHDDSYVLFLSSIILTSVSYFFHYFDFIF
jgi:hypothetical protein